MTRAPIHDGPLMPVVELGGTHVEAALIDVTRGAVVGSRIRRHLDNAAPRKALVNAIVAVVSALERSPDACLTAAVPGPFDYRTGIGQYAGTGKLEALHDCDLGAALRGALLPSPSHVHFINDAEAFALGEWFYGAARGHRRAVALTLGSGIGSAFLVDGEVVIGGTGVPANGHVYNLDWDGAELEDAVSRRAIIARYRAEVPSADLDVRDIATHARAGEAFARAVLADAFRTLGHALAPWLAAFEATILVVGGSIARSWDIVAPPLSAGLVAERASLATQLTLMAAARPSEAALIGAARSGLAHCESTPRPASHPRCR